MVDIKMKKLCFAVSNFSGGGAEKVMVKLANYFHNLGYTVDFMVFSDDGPYKEELNKNVNLFVLNGNKKNFILGLFTAVMRLWKYFMLNNNTVCMSTLRKMNIFVLFIHFISFSKTEVFVREANTLDELLLFRTLSNRIILRSMRYIYPRAKGVIANSIATKKDLIHYLGLYEQDVKVIYNPLDLAPLKYFNLPERKTTETSIIACGRLAVQKNFTDLIDAFPLVLEKEPGARLTILGEGPEREKLEALIEKNGLKGKIILEGFVQNPYKYFTAATVFVHTALWEGFGLVLAEAMACGLSVVAYDCKGAVREVLGEGKYGKLVPVGDLSALAEAIVKLISNPMPKETLDEAISRFGISKIASEYLTYLTKHQLSN